jgi:hypothetical protein
VLADRVEDQPVGGDVGGIAQRSALEQALGSNPEQEVEGRLRHPRRKFRIVALDHRIPVAAAEPVNGGLQALVNAVFTRFP